MNRYLVFLILLALTACRAADRNVIPALESITEEGIKGHIAILASDEFMGRAPATAGEEKTINYLADQYEKLGLLPAADGSFFQKVPLVKITADQNMVLRFAGGKSPVTLSVPDDFIGGTSQREQTIRVDNSELLFVGYGINAPERGWNDYEGLDVTGKTLLIMVNDPGYATSDTSLFDGRAMTYYGRWTYKYEEAARQGAAAAIIIHETGAASYPWEVVQNSWSGPQFFLEDDMTAASPLQVRGWVTTAAARRLFEAAGLDYEELTRSAAVRGFRPAATGLRFTARFATSVEYTISHNVAALWPGEERTDELIIYSAHWDHFGVNNSFEGDTILNGAVDNATGTAGLLEIARAFTTLPKRQARSVLFLSVTCEEQGLLGSDWYARNPLFPPEKSVGVINLDVLNIFGPTHDMTITGWGYNQLEEYAIAVLDKYGRYASPDDAPERGGYFRSDHFSFAKVGIPSLSLSKGIDNIEHGKEWGREQSSRWTMENYHKPSDNYDPDRWNFEGMIQDTRVYFEIGYDLAMTTHLPEWSAEVPFRALREEMMKK